MLPQFSVEQRERLKAAGYLGYEHLNMFYTSISTETIP